MYDPPITNFSHGGGFLFRRHPFQSRWLDSPLLTCYLWCVGKTPMDHVALASFGVHLLFDLFIHAYGSTGSGEFSSWPRGGHWQSNSEPPAGMPDTRHDGGISWVEDLRREKGQYNITSEPEWHVVMSATPYCLTDKSESSAGSLYARVWKWGSWSHSGTF